MNIYDVALTTTIRLTNIQEYMADDMNLRLLEYALSNAYKKVNTWLND